MPAQTRLQWRRDTAANWTSTNPTLADGEIGVATDTKGFKIGDGSTAWNLLPYQSQSTDVGQSSLLLPEGAYLSGSGLVLSSLPYNYASSPDSVPLSITGDVDIKIKCSATDWTPVAARWILAKWFQSTNQRSFQFYLNTNGTIVFGWSNDGINQLDATSTVATGVTDGATKWIRATLDVDDGAGNRVVKFYTSDDGSTWTQLGTTRTLSGATSIFDSTAVLNIGTFNDGATSTGSWNGTIQRVIIQSAYDTVNNTRNLVFDSDFSAQTANSLSFNATSETGIKSGGLTLRGISGQYASTPDSTVLDITGDIDIRCRAALADWTPVSSHVLIAKRIDAGNQQSYSLIINGDGTIMGTWSTTGANIVTATSTVPSGIADGATKWLRWTLDVDNGASGYDAKFFLSDDGINWTQLGATVTGAGVTSIFASTAILEVGSRNTGVNGLINGTIYRVQIFNGINGTLVFDKDFSEEATGSTSFNAFSTVGIGQDGLVLNGAASQSASTPDANVLDITGDMEIVTRVAPTTWTPASAQRLISKSHSTTSQRSWNLTLWTNGTIILYASADGVNVSQAQSTSTVGGVNGQPIWLKVTRRKSDGRVQFFKANDQATEPSSWTQIGADVNILINSDLFSGSATVEFGGSTVDGSNFSGTIYRSILRNGIGGTTVLDANFEAAKIGASSFVESSSNAATVTINGITNPVVTVSGSTDPTVTINTTRYSLGVPNLFAQSVTTGGISANTIYYNPFVIENPISVDMLAFEVTAGPASAANAIVGIYKLDKNGQPIGAPILNSGNIPITASATGMFRKQFTPTIIQPGVYAIAMAVSVTMTIRQIRGGVCAAAPTMGATPYRSLGYATFAVSQGSLPSTPIRWTVLGSSSVASWYQCFMRYTSV